VAHAVADGAVIVTKDSDFPTWAPPLLLVTTGNISNRALTALFEERVAAVVDLLADGQSGVEIG
jgi:predicted nuclease of predicted toxin-antitoxin system